MPERPESRQEWRTLRQQTSEATKALRAQAATIRLSLEQAAADHYGVPQVIDRPTFTATVKGLNARLAHVESRLAEADEAADLADTMTDDDRSELLRSFLAMDPDTPDADRAPMDVDELRTLIAATYRHVKLLPRGRGVRTLGPEHFDLLPRHAADLTTVGD